MDKAALRLAAISWCDAWSRQDLDAVMAHYADRVEFSSPTVPLRWGRPGGWLHGKDELRKNFAIGMTQPGIRFEFIDILFGVNAACVLYRRETGRMVTDLVEYDEAGHAIRVVACYGE